MTKFEWDLEKHGELAAGRVADDLVQRHGYTAPIDPLTVVKLERDSLRTGGADFKDCFDGKLKYFPKKRCFTLLYNTKYDVGYPAGKHHPRTRFSIAHELGHYFLDAHREYLLKGGMPHPSRSEFRRVHRKIEREADAFAASLLLPTQLIRSKVNRSFLTLSLIDELSRDFQTSPICTTFRTVSVSDDPCAVAGIRDGEVKWLFPSDRLIQGACYPRKGYIKSDFAVERWEAFRAGDTSRLTHEGEAADWLSIYGKAAKVGELTVHEHYLPVKMLGTLVVLLTLDDNEVFGFG